MAICLTMTIGISLAKYVIDLDFGTISLNVKVENQPVEWEKVYGDPNAPYEDANGKYYIRYVGDITHRTWVDVVGFGWENGKILDTEITNTYKMFEKTENTQEVSWVILDYAQLGNLNSNMLTGQRDGVSIVYRDNTITEVTVNRPQATSRAQTVNDASTEQFDAVKAVYPNNDVYWWLEQSTINGNPYLHGGIQAYLGNITSVYVPANVTSVPGSYTIAGLFSQNSNVQSVMLDPEGTWTSIEYTFQYCSSIRKFPSQFVIPETVTNMNYTFSQCFALEEFEVKIPSSVTKMNRTFNLCSVLSADITLPEGVTDCRAVIRMAGSQEPGLSNLVYDDAGNYVTSGGKYNIVIRYNGAGSADYGTSSTGMKYDYEKTTVFIDYSSTSAQSTAGQSLAAIEIPAAVDTEPAVETESPAPGEEETPEPDEEEIPEPGKEEAPEPGGEMTDPGDAETTEPAAPGETTEAPTEMPAAVTAVQ